MASRCVLPEEATLLCIVTGARKEELEGSCATGHLQTIALQLTPLLSDPGSLWLALCDALREFGGPKEADAGKPGSDSSNGNSNSSNVGRSRNHSNYIPAVLARCMWDYAVKGLESLRCPDDLDALMVNARWVLEDEAGDEEGSVATVSTRSQLGVFISRSLVTFEGMSFSQVGRLLRQLIKAAGQVTAIRKRGFLGKKEEEKGVTAAAAAAEGGDRASVSSTVDLHLPPVERQPDARAIVGSLEAMRLRALSNPLSAACASERQRLQDALCSPISRLQEHSAATFENCLVSGEFVSALDALHRANDLRDTQGRPARLGDALIQRARLHYAAGHHKAAVRAVHEAVRVAQDSGDPACAQEALAWLVCLGGVDPRLRLRMALLALEGSSDGAAGDGNGRNTAGNRSRQSQQQQHHSSTTSSPALHALAALAVARELAGRGHDPRQVLARVRSAATGGGSLGSGSRANGSFDGSANTGHTGNGGGGTSSSSSPASSSSSSANPNPTAAVASAATAMILAEAGVPGMALALESACWSLWGCPVLARAQNLSLIARAGLSRGGARPEDVCTALIDDAMRAASQGRHASAAATLARARALFPITAAAAVPAASVLAGQAALTQTAAAASEMWMAADEALSIMAAAASASGSSDDGGGGRGGDGKSTVVALVPLFRHAELLSRRGQHTLAADLLVRIQHAISAAATAGREYAGAGAGAGGQSDLSSPSSSSSFSSSPPTLIATRAADKSLLLARQLDVVLATATNDADAGRYAEALYGAVECSTRATGLGLRTHAARSQILAAEVMLQLGGMEQRAAAALTNVAGHVLAHGSQTLCARLRLSMAHCQLSGALTPTGKQAALASLRLARGFSRRAGEKSLERKCVHAMACVCHASGEIAARNRYAGQLRALRRVQK